MKLRWTLCLILVVALAGCSAKNRRLTDQQIASVTYSVDTSSIPKKEITIDRRAFKDIISRGPEVMNIRLVELFAGTDVPPRYRVMAYNKNGPYEYLGLQVGDVILAANNYIMRQSSLFPTYVQLLSDTETGSIHIVRQGREVILDLKIQ